MREFLTGETYELLSSAATVQFQNVGKGTLIVKRAVSQPAASENGWKYPPWSGERGAVDDLFPTETGSLWVRSEESTTVQVEEL